MGRGLSALGWMGSLPAPVGLIGGVTSRPSREERDEGSDVFDDAAGRRGSKPGDTLTSTSTGLGGFSGVGSLLGSSSTFQSPRTTLKPREPILRTLLSRGYHHE
jgi:hypothetical protein